MRGAKKTFLDELDKQPATSPLIRGKGVVLSTQQGESQSEEVSRNLEKQKSGKAESQKVKEKDLPSRVERIKLGNEIRKDLVLALKRIALDEERYDYEIIEEALEQYIARRSQGSKG